MYRIGIDVGGTNTDAVLLDENLQVLAKIKTPTTTDVSEGIDKALQSVLSQCDIPRNQIRYAMLGTTQCTNAIVERKRLNRIAVIRLGLPATAAIRPMTGWPEDLRQALDPQIFLVGGGHEFDGREINSLDTDELRRIAKAIKGQVDSVAITSVFSPVAGEHEQQAAQILQDELGDTPITLSQQIGSVGLLERENATILNAALIEVARTTVDGFIEALHKEHVTEASVYIAQNDGTLMDQAYARRYPIFTIACGPTNSIRGAAFLSGRQEALVVDIGGTTTDVGVLVNGFPRESSMAVEIGGVRTNFRMPDLISIGLGGGSRVRPSPDGVKVGPDSVGYALTTQGMLFGGDTMTASDIAVAAGHAKLGDPSRVSHLPAELVADAYKQIVSLAEDAIERIKIQAGKMPVVLVGGGSILMPDQLQGASEIIRPQHYEIANALGSAIAQVSGQTERIFSLDAISRDQALAEAKQFAINEAIKAGAAADSVQIVDIEDVPLAYLPGNATRIRVKAAGDLKE